MVAYRLVQVRQLSKILSIPQMTLFSAWHALIVIAALECGTQLESFRPELDRVTSLVNLYLEGAKGIDDSKELTAYLHGARGKLLDTCNGFCVCGALYELCDRFSQLFDPTRGILALGQA